MMKIFGIISMTTKIKNKFLIIIRMDKLINTQYVEFSKGVQNSELEVA